MNLMAHFVEQSLCTKRRQRAAVSVISQAEQEREKIIKLLEKRGELSVQQIATAMKLDRQKVLDRMKYLGEKGMAKSRHEQQRSLRVVFWRLA